MATRILAIANQKGGVGKTTTATNIGGELARRGFRVLLIDLDPQGNATTSLGIAKQGLAATVYEVLMGRTAAAAAIVATGRDRFDLLPADQDLAGAMVELTGVDRREWQLQAALATLDGSYDWILIDCPPSLGLLTLNGLCAAGSVLIPLQCEYLALEGLAQLRSTIQLVRDNLNPRLRIVGVAMTMYDGRTNLAQQVLEEVQRYFPKLIFRHPIPRSIRFGEAPSHGMLISEYDPQSRATASYAALTDELIQREERA